MTTSHDDERRRRIRDFELGYETEIGTLLRRFRRDVERAGRREDNDQPPRKKGRYWYRGMVPKEPDNPESEDQMVLGIVDVWRDRDGNWRANLDGRILDIDDLPGEFYGPASES